MIAKNFMKYPEALRFQRELFSKGFHNSPRIMRLMECIFDWAPVAPGWWTAAKARARTLAKQVRKSIDDFFRNDKLKASDQLPIVYTFTIDEARQQNEDAAWERLNTFSKWMDKTFSGALTTTPDVTARMGHKNSATGANWYMQCQGAYRLFCPTQKHAMSRGGWAYQAVS